MTLRISTAIRNAVLEASPAKLVMGNAKLKLYSGAQPADATQAPTGTLLCTYTAAGGAFTAEVQSAGSITLVGASGSVNTVTVNSIGILDVAVPFNTTLTQTAVDLAAAINNNPKNALFVATSSGAVVTLTAKLGQGVTPNGWVVTGTNTTLAPTYINMGTVTAGVDSVNGLRWGDAAAGVLNKHPTQVWQGTAVATGTAGWFRIEAAVADSGALDNAELYNRIDGAVAVSGAELQMASLAIVTSAVQTISSFAVTMPANA